MKYYITYGKCNKKGTLFVNIYCCFDDIRQARRGFRQACSREYQKVKEHKIILKDGEFVKVEFKEADLSDFRNENRAFNGAKVLYETTFDEKTQTNKRIGERK